MSTTRGYDLKLRILRPKHKSTGGLRCAGSAAACAAWLFANLVTAQVVGPTRYAVDPMPQHRGNLPPTLPGGIVTYRVADGTVSQTPLSTNAITQTTYCLNTQQSPQVSPPV